MANSTPIDPRRLGQRSAGGFTPVDLKAGAANLRGTSKPKTPVPAPTPVRENRSKPRDYRSEEHTSELQSLMRISYAVFCLKKKTNIYTIRIPPSQTQHTRHQLRHTVQDNA